MKALGLCTVIALAVAASSPIYGQDARGQSGIDKAAPQRPAQTGQPPHADAQAFVNDMTIAGLAEVQLGKMASERSNDADVKAFGQMMVKDHSQANDELKQIASQLEIQPPTQLDQKHKELADKLSKLQGAEFDREYMNAMVQGHQEVLGKLRARADAALPSAQRGAAGDHSGAEAPREKGLPSTTTNSNKPVAQDPATAKAQTGKGATTSHGLGDEALTQWVAKAMPRVQGHLDRAKEIQQKLTK
jgi:putative membrane protein